MPMDTLASFGFAFTHSQLDQLLRDWIATTNAV
jgi:hypothetical protein